MLLITFLTTLRDCCWVSFEMVNSVFISCLPLVDNALKELKFIDIVTQFQIFRSARILLYKNGQSVREKRL
jgi:hypothetical protein